MSVSDNTATLHDGLSTHCYSASRFDLFCFETFFFDMPYREHQRTFFEEQEEQSSETLNLMGCNLALTRVFELISKLNKN